MFWFQKNNEHTYSSFSNHQHLFLGVQILAALINEMWRSWEVFMALNKIILLKMLQSKAWYSWPIFLQWRVLCIHSYYLLLFLTPDSTSPSDFRIISSYCITFQFNITIFSQVQYVDTLLLFKCFFHLELDLSAQFSHYKDIPITLSKWNKDQYL